MKTMPLAAVLMAVLAWQPMTAQANPQNLAATICDHVAANNKSELRARLKASGVRLRNLYAGVRCNGESLLRFAMMASADEAGPFMAKKLPGSLLSEPEGDGQTLLGWAEANGFGQSATAEQVRERID